MGDAISESQYRTAKGDIAIRHQSDQAACEAMAGNAKDVCNAESNGRESVAKAELEQAYAPSLTHDYDVHIAKAAANYAIANEKCDESAGNVQDVCRKEAKSAEAVARADAELMQKSAAANTGANEANGAAARKAAMEKRDAAYAVAKEKCDSLADAAQASCIADAKKAHGQS